MSLISDALRKAREEAAARDAGLPLPHHLPAPRERRRGSLLSALVIALVAAAAGGGAGAWWLSRTGQTSSPGEVRPRTSPADTGSGASGPAGIAPGPAAPASAATILPSQAIPSSRDTTTPTPSASPVAPQQVTASPARAAEPAPMAPVPASVPEPAGDRRTAPSPRQSPPESGPGEKGEQVFVIDATVGSKRLHLDFIVYKPSAPFAGVNGQQVVPGSIIEGLRVESIGPSSVTLGDGTRTIVLRVR